MTAYEMWVTFFYTVMSTYVDTYSRVTYNDVGDVE